MKQRENEAKAHRGRKAGMVVSVRLKPEEAEELVMLSRRYGTSLSDTLRLAVDGLARATDYTTLRLQSSGLGHFTRAELDDEPLVLTQSR